jgi:DNA repair protein RadC
MAKTFKEDDREKPREKLQRLGTEGLKNEELLALILRTGYKGKDVMQVAGDVCRKFPGKELFEKSFKDLSAVKGVGRSRAAAILAGFELSKRVLEKSRRVQVANPRDALAQFNEIRDRRKEHFVAVYLNARNEMICKEFISIGILDASLVHPREVFAPALEHNACGVIFAHNHPSGNASPSDDDRKLTKRLIEAGKILGIEVLDHLVVTRDDFYSFKEDGAL